MYTLTLNREDMINFVTGGQPDVDESVITAEIERYAQELEQHLGSEWRVEVSAHVIQDYVDGFVLQHTEHAEAIGEAMAYVTQRFW